MLWLGRWPLGLVVNPLAGIGGAVGLQGSDGEAVQRAARELDGKPRGQERLTIFLAATFSSSSTLRERAAEGKDVVVGGNSGDASINLDINQLLRWENAHSSISSNSSGSSNSDINLSRSSSVTVGKGFVDQRSESDKSKGVAET